MPAADENSVIFPRTFQYCSIEAAEKLLKRMKQETMEKIQHCRKAR